MTSSDSPAPTPGNAVAWDASFIFSILSDAMRYRILATLARNGPQAASQLMGSSSRKFSATLKHMVMMERAGLLVRTPDRADKRRMLYSLSPSLPLVKSETDVALEFGFCLVRL
ncbi:MAG: Helix-turn-helix domain [Verrucomicrobiota bacterium]